MTPREEAIQLLKSANAIAILLGGSPSQISSRETWEGEPSWDTLGASVALAQALKQTGKSVSIFTAGLPAPLPPMFAENDLFSGAAPPRDFIISFDLTRSPIKELRYERAENRLNIILSPQGGALRREDVEFRSGPFAYDLVVTLGVAEIRAIEPTVKETPELIHEKMILNIDYRSENTGYGDVNVIDPQAGSLSEIVSRLLEELGVAISPDVATALLAGMAEASRYPFTAKSLSALPVMARLLDAGADAGAVARALAERRDPGLIRLLGRALARSRYQPETGTLCAVLNGDDFSQTGRSPTDLPRILEELGTYFPIAQSVLLLWQHPADTLIRVAARGHGLARGRSDGPTFTSFREAEEFIRQGELG